MKNNIQLFKTIDPLFQSVLFLLFTYSLNNLDPKIDHFFSDKIIFEVLLGWQIISAILHKFFRKTSMLKKQRKAYLIVVASFTLIYIAVSLFIPEVYVQDLNVDGFVQIPVYRVSMVAAGMCICFWYSVICFREIRRIYKKANFDS